MKVLNQNIGEKYAMYQGDAIEVTKGLPSNSVHYSIFSPPFVSLFTYSDSERDLGNSKDTDSFVQHFSFLVKELYRVLIPGRLISFHCMNFPATIGRDGYIGMKDFRGDLIRSFLGDSAFLVPAINILKTKRAKALKDNSSERVKEIDVSISLIEKEMEEDSRSGFIYHSEVCIWKDPLVQATRTKVLTLAHKQISKDSSRCAQGLPDYIVTMRKPGVNPEPISHGRGFERYFGTKEEPSIKLKTDSARTNKYSHKVWQRYASPVWFDINQTDTLNVKMAREKEDERHICPLQLCTIARCLELWTNSGDIVLSPFAGIGSEGVQAVEMGRRFIGIELKESYYNVAVKYLDKADTAPRQLEMFS